MVDMLELQTISICVASASVLVAAIYYMLTLRNQGKARQTDLVTKLYATYGTPEFQRATLIMRDMEFKDYDDYSRKYGQDFEKRVAWLSTAALFEEIGVLVNKKLAGIDLVCDLFSTPVIKGWEKVQNLVKDERMRFNRPQIWKWFEYLNNEIKKREQKLQ